MTPTDFMVSFLQNGVATLNAEQHDTFRNSVRRYYESLPSNQQPQGWADVREELEERDAIQAEGA